MHLFDRLRDSSPMLAYVLAGLLITSIVARSSNIVNFYFRLVLVFCGIIVACIVGISSAVVLAPVGRRTDIDWVVARTFYWFNRLVLGLRSVVDHPERIDPRKPCIYVANHQSMLDLIALGCIFPKRCVITAKNSLKYYPFLGQFMQLGSNIFINRGNKQQAVQVFKDAVDIIHQKQLSVFIFPEGTRGRLLNATLLPFKKGAFHMAVQAGVPVVPLVFSDFHLFYCKKEKRFESGTITIKALEPISTQGMTAEDVDKLTNDVRDRMSQALIEMAQKDANKKHD
ncbi:1-acylglycerol-3-phosphate O-acyltransferase [Dimargaris xerosporica]|nr:1-acylglycerol-3-phosphate O-acyltransferase [Dimargaris xerosporica]